MTPHSQPLKRSMIFIDGSNLTSGWRDCCKTRGNPKAKISYRSLLKELSNETDLVRGYYYDASQEPISAERQKFNDMLRGNAVTVVMKKLRFRSNTCKHCGKVDVNMPYQKGVDVAIVTELMSLGFEDAYDVAIIVSGDNDFVDAVNHVKSKGRRVWVAAFSSRLGQDLMRSADKVIHLEKIADRIVKH